MTIESATYISDLNASYPGASDQKSEGDDHIRLLKSTTKATFPNVAGAVSATHTELSYVHGVTSAIQTQLDSKAASTAVAGFAPLAGASFTGTVNAPNYLISTAGGTIGYTGLLGAGIEIFGASSGTPNVINFRTNNVLRLTINAAGSAVFTGDIQARTFTGGLAGNISQFTNDAGYITATGAAAAGSLTGTALASNVVSSSLTSVGNLSALTVTSPIVGSVTGSAGSVAWTSVTGKPTVFSTVSTVTNFTGSDVGAGSYITDVSISAVGSAITLTIARTYHTGGGGGGP